MNPECDLETETKYEDRCTVISDPEGPFKDCINKVPNEVISVLLRLSLKICTYLH